MKKRFLILSILVVLVLSFCFGCGNSVEGKYRFDKLYDSSTDKIYNIDDKYDGEVLTKEFCVIILESGNNMTIKISDGNRTIETAGVWYKGPLDCYALESKTFSGTAYFDGDTLVFDTGYEIIFLEKA